MRNFNQKFIIEKVLKTVQEEIGKAEFDFHLFNDYFSCNIYSSNTSISDFLNKYLSPYFQMNSDEMNGDIQICIIKIANIVKYEFDFSDCTVVDILKHKNKDKEIKAYNICFDKYKVYYIIRSGNIIMMNFENRSIVIIGERDEELLRDLVLVIRDSSYIHLVLEGYVQIHAASVVVKDDKAILFVGKSNSGKTTSLLHTIKDERCELLSNGRVFVKQNDETITIIGTPENIGVRKRTLQEFVEFQDFLNAQKEEVKLGYKDLCSRFHCNIKSRGHLYGITITNFGGTINQLMEEGLFERTVVNEVVEYSDIKRREWIAFHTVDNIKYDNNAQEIRDLLLKCKNISMTYLEHDQYKIYKMKDR